MNQGSQPSQAHRRRILSKPLLLDLFCCVGGGASGYSRAGFTVVGVDKDPQPLYPFEFIQGDAVAIAGELLASGKFSAVHLSPPCQFASVYGNNRNHVKKDHPNLIPAARQVATASGLPYVIENVEGARDHLLDPVKICGTGLNVPIRRHRYFETNWELKGVDCDHGRFTERRFPGSSNRPNGRTVMNVGEYRVPVSTQREIMEMPWSDLYGISQAIPPVYTEHIGKQLMSVVRHNA